jgi:ubiquinol-cytochrome c reductase cytochrome c subunit
MLLSSFTFLMGSAHAANTNQTPYQTDRKDAGTGNSTNSTIGPNGQVISYGNSAITYTAPDGTKFHMTQAQFVQLGQALFQQECASCHGNTANGVPQIRTPGNFPNLRNESAAAVDFWIESGRMPAANPRDVQAQRRPPKLNHKEALAIAAWITTLSNKTAWPLIPQANLKGGSLADGSALFALNCAACHTITGDGDALAFDTYAPSLRNVPVVQITEAIRTGPGNMPRFTGNLSDAQVRDIVKYVSLYIQHPRNPGGLGLGGLGPVAEGFIGLALGVGLLMLAGFWVGERQ